MLIICPHCKFYALYNVSIVEDAIRENKPIVCVDCNNPFGLVTVCLTRPPEQRNGADLAQQTCPSCHGEKRLLTGFNQFIECPTCKGTGHV